MKAAPEKIYIRPLPNPSDGYVGIAWDEPHKTMVEYVRKDAFIEKACDWIDYNNRNGGCNFDGWKKDFKKYMEGE